MSMKILIIGECSGFSKNLSIGFRKLGHETFVFSWGDGYKKIEQEYSYTFKSYNHSKKNILNKVMFYYHILKEKRKLDEFVKSMSRKINFDVVLILDTLFIRYAWQFWIPVFTKKMVLSLVKDPNQIYLSSCGYDLPYVNYWKNHKSKNYTLVKFHTKNYESIYQKKKLKYVRSFVHKVIPIMYDYSEAWRNCPYVKDWLVLPTIPLPIDLSGIKIDNNVGDKIFIFHGINRAFDKGTSYIIEALERIQKEYKDKVVCYAKGGMPFEEYKQILSKTNISVDQVYAYSTGMNGLYSLAMGKVLLSGNEPENMQEFNYNNIPIINIVPDSEMIYSQLKSIIEKPYLIQKLSEKGRKYVEHVHEAKLVAQKYIDMFNYYGKE